MKKAVIKTDVDDLFLDIGWLLVLQFADGYAPFRITGKAWSNLSPWSLGTVGALGNLSIFDAIQDNHNNYILEPFNNDLIFHTFWGVSPRKARIMAQFPPRADLGSMQSNPRAINATGDVGSGNIGYIDGEKSPFNGPFSRKTELFTINDLYPQFQVFNPTNDAIYNAELNFDQMQYTYNIIQDKALIKDMLVGRIPVKKYTMGPAYNGPASAPDWLKKAVTPDVWKYTTAVLEGTA
jgi:hypothetical protein